MIYLELFLHFLKIGAVSFGGGYGMISLIRETVLENGWLTENEFLSFIAVSESTPGPLAVNMATFIGSSQGGVAGSFFATLGVILPSFIIIFIIAALIGLITPAWIVFGLGLMPLPRLPHIFFTPPALLLQAPGGWPFLCTVLLTMVTGFLFGSTALLRILGFNARARAYNGFLALLGIYTGVLALINFTALPDYVTLLNACVAFQIGHFFRATASRRGYIVILVLLAAYTALYIWSAL